MDSNPMQNIKSIKSKSNLNKPFDDISAILNEIKAFNYNLYLCCIMTYGCLLRPHREVRELTWGDFTADLSYINYQEVETNQVEIESFLCLPTLENC